MDDGERGKRREGVLERMVLVDGKCEAGFHRAYQLQHCGQCTLRILKKM